MSVKVVMISGKQGSGKTTLANDLAASARERGYVVIRTRFAKILYEMHDSIKDIARGYGIPFPDKHGELLQWIGTEGFRNRFGQDVWVNALKKDVSNQLIPLSITDRAIVIIDDLRFENEFDAYSGDDVFKIRLEAPRHVRKARCDAWRESDTHPSETALDDHIFKFDRIFDTSIQNKEVVLSETEREVFGNGK